MVKYTSVKIKRDSAPLNRDLTFATVHEASLDNIRDARLAHVITPTTSSLAIRKGMYIEYLNIPKSPN